MQVVFKKFIMSQNTTEEEKSEESVFQPVKDLLQSGVLTNEEDGKEKKLRADDIFSAFLQKLPDAAPSDINANFVPFLKAWLESGSLQNENWKFVVRRSVTELENYVSELPELPSMLTKGLILPLIHQNIIQINDLQWFKEEEKDELYDVRS